MAFDVTAEEIAKEHKLGQKEAKQLQELVVTQLLIHSVANLPRGFDNTNYQGQLERLMGSAPESVNKAFEDYLLRLLHYFEGAAAV